MSSKVGCRIENYCSFFLCVYCYNSAEKLLRHLIHACIKIPMGMFLLFKIATGPGMGSCRVNMAVQHIHLEAFWSWSPYKKCGMSCNQNLKVKIKNHRVIRSCFSHHYCIICVWTFLSLMITTTFRLLSTRLTTTFRLLTTRLVHWSSSIVELMDNSARNWGLCI